MATTQESRLAPETARDGVDTRTKEKPATAEAGTGETTRLGAGDQGQVGSDAASGSFVERLVAQLVESTNRYGVRSSKRTDTVHGLILAYIEGKNPNVSGVVEYRLPTELGNFDVDIAVFDKVSQKLLVCVLFKGLTSSISKNSKNYEHNKIGEAVKAKSGMGVGTKLVYIDVVPVRCPTYKGNGTIKGWEKHLPEKVRQDAVRLQRVVNIGRTTPIIDDIYTVSVDYEYASDHSIALGSIVNDSDMTRFDQLIAGLAPVEAQMT
jgi:hypothetical protein